MKGRYVIRERKIVVIILIAAVAITVFGFIVMSLWNAILPAVLHVSAITFWQALGILVLSKILFGGFHGGNGGRWRNRRNQWLSMESKMAAMTPEEREKFKREWKNRCGPWGRPFQSPQDTSTQTATSAE